MSDTTRVPTDDDGFVDPLDAAVAIDAARAVESAHDVLMPSLPPEGERRRREAMSGRAFRAVKAQHAAELHVVERFAERLTRVVSSAPFLVLHVVWYTTWILWNTGALGLREFDPYPFGFLTMVVSLEAIFLSLFVLMSQNRESAIAELREEVTLQVNLRMEAEVTKTLQLIAGLYTRMGYRTGEDPELVAMLQPLDAQEIERELIEQIRASRPGRDKKRPR